MVLCVFSDPWGWAKGSPWLSAINFCTVVSVNCNRLLLTLSREKCDFFIGVYFLINPVLSLCIHPSSETLFLLHLMAFLLPTRRLTAQGWHFSSVSFSSCQLLSSLYFFPSLVTVFLCLASFHARLLHTENPVQGLCCTCWGEIAKLAWKWL